MEKRLISCITGLSLLLTFGLTACGGEKAHIHDMVAGSTTATCGEAGETTYYCSGCSESSIETTPATGKHNFEGKVCKDCGYTDFGGTTVDAAIAEYGYYIEDVDGSKTYTTGDLVYFGSYPQSVVNDAATVALLAAQQGTLPSEDNAGDWISYRYYSQGEQADYMFYKDIAVNGKKYRGVYLLNYRPYYSQLAAGADNSYIDNQGFELNTVYWFGYEPIKWNVLEYSGGKLFLSSKYSLEGQPYQAVYEGDDKNMVIPGTETFVNDWEASSVRSFLNNDFYNLAFTEREQLFIQTITLDNSMTGYSADNEFQKNQNATRDKVFLQSYEDLKNVDYGYTSRSMIKSRSFTKYATIQGCRPSGEGNTLDGEAACYYMLRSAGDTRYAVCGVNKKGTVTNNVATFSLTDSSDGLAVNGDFGVLPALYIRVGKTAQGVWEDFDYPYTASDGSAAKIECSLYVPSSYIGGKKLPLITYVPDSTYVGSNLKQYKAAACPQNWLTEDKMQKNPVFMLLIRFSETGTGGAAGDLVVSIIDKLIGEYGIDEDRLYLTGQSMGGILDFAINDAYPDKFAATVYVGCQPGGNVGDEQYNAIIASAKFANQKFVYIASRLDEKAPYGQDAVEQALKDKGVEYGKLYDLDHKGGDALNSAVKAELDKGYAQTFLGFKQVTGTGDGVAEHMQSFKYAYAIDAVFDWLVAQHK